MTEITDVYKFTSGPRDARILLVGEAWGYDEARQQRPFVGLSGQLLDKMLTDSGLNRANILTTNVVSAQPFGNDFTGFLNPGTKITASNLRGVFATPKLLDGHARLLALVQQVKPDLIIGCGNWPLWALTSHAKLSTTKGYRLPSGIMSWRGSQTWTDEIDGIKYPYLPIIHPAAINRDWSLRHVTCHDIRSRAARYLNAGKDPASFRRLWSGRGQPTLENPSFKQATEWLRGVIGRADAAQREFRETGISNPIQLCCDVETWRRTYLSVVGLCDGQSACVIPYFFFNTDGRLIDYWMEHEEYEINYLIRKLMLHPFIQIINQNYAYDFMFLQKYIFISKYPYHDTMLAHHILYPGTPKSLDYLASLYASHYVYWKDESQDWDAKSSHLDMWRYNGKDIWYTWEIAQVLQQLVKHAKMEDLYDLQMEQWKIYIEASCFGVRWDYQRAAKMRLDLLEVSTSLGQTLDQCMPEDLRSAPSGKPWYSSNTQQQWIFYDLLGIKPVTHKKTKKPTLNAEAFETLKKRAPWLSPIFQQMTLLRSVNVFAKNFLDVGLGRDKRLHSSFNVGATETFRLSSSSNPFDEGMNLQNLPRKQGD